MFVASNEPMWCGWQLLLTLHHFTFWISLSLRHLPSPKFGLRPKISQKVKSFFVSTQWIAERLPETKLRTERSLSPKLINSAVDFACTRWVNQLEIKFWWTKITSLFSLIHKEIRRYQRWRYGVSSDVCRSDWLIWTWDWDQSWAVWSVSEKDWSKKWNYPVFYPAISTDLKWPVMSLGYSLVQQILHTLMCVSRCQIWS